MLTRRLLFTVVVVVWVSVSTAARGDSNSWYVDANGSDLNEGNSWGEAFATIQKGIDKARNGDVVNVNRGRYYETIDFKGKAITLRGTDPNNWVVVAATIIDANGSGDVVTFENKEDGNSVFEGFTIRNGDRGIYCKQASPIMERCIITNNHSRRDGAGMYNSKASPTVINCVFSGNVARKNGGGMYNERKSCPVVINCVFYANTAANQDGGGMYNKDSSPTIINCTFFGNKADEQGGGIMNRSGSNPTLTNCIFWGNHARDEGGEIYNRRCKPLFNYCTVEAGLNDEKCGGDKSEDGDDNEGEDPGFVDASDPDGKDNIWGTSDDGLIPTARDVADEGHNKTVKERRITTDIKGDPRIIGRHVDMGAYEYKPRS